jgi:hypothetical protein
LQTQALSGRALVAVVSEVAIQSLGKDEHSAPALDRDEFAATDFVPKESLRNPERLSRFPQAPSQSGISCNTY